MQCDPSFPATFGAYFFGRRQSTTGVHSIDLFCYRLLPQLLPPSLTMREISNRTPFATLVSFHTQASAHPLPNQRTRPCRRRRHQHLLLLWCIVVATRGRCTTATWIDPDTPSENFHSQSKSSDDNRRFRLVRLFVCFLQSSQSKSNVGTVQLPKVAYLFS